MDIPHIVITGNPVDGFIFYGPFKSSEDAIDYGENDVFGEWWIAEIEEPEGA